MASSKVQFRTIDEYVASFPENIRRFLEEIRRAIREKAPAAEETMSYGIPTFDLDGKHLVHFAAYKNHIGFYPTPSAILAFKKEIAAFETSKGSIQFPVDKSIPVDLVKKLVEFRVEKESKKKRSRS